MSNLLYISLFRKQFTYQIQDTVGTRFLITGHLNTGFEVCILIIELPAPDYYLKLKVMKKFLAIAATAFTFAACGGSQTDNATVENHDSVTTNTTTTTTTTTSNYNASEGDVQYTGNKVRVMRGGQWVDADNDVTLDSGVVVSKTGRVRKNKSEVELKEGEIVSKTGNFFDKSGRAIENAWDATKEGAKDAGNAVKKAANKVGDKVEDAVDGHDRH